MPFDSFARSVAGSFAVGGWPMAGMVERSTDLPAAASFGNGCTSSMYTPSESQAWEAFLTSSAVAASSRASRVL